MGKDTNYLRIWGTYLRWSSLCREAWKIVFSGRVPFTYSTPPIVREYGKVTHNKLVSIVRKWFEQDYNTLYLPPGETVEYSFKPDWSERSIVLVVKPDLYVLWSTGNNRRVNVVVEVTTRMPKYIPEEWLAAYMLGFYIKNLQPTFILLVHPEKVQALPLSSKLVRRLKSLIDNCTRREPTPSLCYNCDLRPVCLEPLV